MRVLQRLVKGKREIKIGKMVKEKKENFLCQKCVLRIQSFEDLKDSLF